MPKIPRSATARRLFFATAAALAAILWGALFLIAPVWQISKPAAAYAPSGIRSESAASTPSGDTIIDVNTADADALTALPGIGPAKAAAIVAYRNENGPFADLSDLEKVSGISVRMVESWSGLAIAGTSDIYIH